MAINKGELFTHNDVYIDYSFEEVMFRWDHKTKKIYVKFYGEDEKVESVSHDNRLFNDSLLYGNEIT